MAEKYYSVSPYAFCSENPVTFAIEREQKELAYSAEREQRKDPQGLNFVDVDGEDWYSYDVIVRTEEGNELHNTQYEWTEAKSQSELEELGIEGGTYLGQAVVVLDGFYDEQLGDAGTLTGEGAKAANVTIYGVNGADDISTYNGLTVSSDKNIYPMIQSGDYKASYQKMSTSVYAKDALTYRIYETTGSANITPEGGYNKKTGLDVITGVYLRRTNWNGNAKAASQGCLVIDVRSWKSVEKQLGKSNDIYIKLNRK